MYYVIIIIIIKNNHLSGSKLDATEGQKKYSISFTVWITYHLFWFVCFFFYINNFCKQLVNGFLGFIKSLEK